MRALIAAGGVALLQGLLWFAWGSPAPIYDEAGYLAGGEAVARLVRCSLGLEVGPACGAVGFTDLGRLLWHNPGWSALFVVAELLPGSAAAWIRGLNLVAGLLAGLATWAALNGALPRRHAMGAAALVWLLPAQLYFRLTLWPVALGTALVAGALLAARRAAERPTPARQHQLGLLLLALVLVWPLALAAVPLVGLGMVRLGGRESALRTVSRVAGPALGAWVLLVLTTSLALQVPTNGTLASPENLALANNPWIPRGRGSSLHAPESVRRVRFEAHQVCPQGNGLPAVRCRARVWRSLAGDTIAQAPGAAVGRAGLRILETWRRDDYLPRHVADERTVLRRPPPPFLIDVEQVTELLVLALLFVSAALGARDRRVLALLAVVALCTLPVALGVGVTRLRQPLLPIIAVAAALTLARYHRAP